MNEPTDREQRAGRAYHRVMSGRGADKGMRALIALGMDLDEGRAAYLAVQRFEHACEAARRERAAADSPTVEGLNA